jgi:hypothetical protein
MLLSFPVADVTPNEVTDIKCAEDRVGTPHSVSRSGRATDAQ